MNLLIAIAFSVCFSLAGMLIGAASAQPRVHPRHAPSRLTPHYNVRRDPPPGHEFSPTDIIIMPLDAFLSIMPRISPDPDARR